MKTLRRPSIVLILMAGLLSCHSQIEAPNRIEKRSTEIQGDGTAGDANPPAQSSSSNPLPQGSANVGGLSPASKFILLAGTSEQIGSQQGAVFKVEIKSLLETWLEPKLNGFSTSGALVATSMSTTMSKYLTKDMQTEVDAVAKASGVASTRVMIANDAADIMELVAANNFFGCSTLTIAPSRSETQAMLIGRNLDYDESEVLRSAWRPVVFARTGKHKIFSVHIPGLSTVLTGINEKGVFMAIKVSTGKTTRNGMPSGFIFRSILETANTALEAVDLYKKQKRTVALNVTIADGKDAFELEADSVSTGVRTFSTKGTLYGANHFELASMRGSSENRDSRWSKLASLDAKPTPINLADVKQVISQAGGFGSDPSTNVLAVFVDYKAREIIYGSDPKGLGKAAAGELWTFRFDDIFK